MPTKGGERRKMVSLLAIKCLLNKKRKTSCQPFFLDMSRTRSPRSHSLSDDPDHRGKDVIKGEIAEAEVLE